MSLRISKAGLLDTAQDLGRYGHQHQGINPGGAMDRFSAGIANTLLGKDLHAPVLELHFPAAQILFQKPAIICLAGADFSPMINGQNVPLHQPVAISENSLLTFGGKQRGARCYLAIAGKIKLEPWLNSYSTNLKAGAGGYKGRQLQKGDELLFEPVAFQTSDELVRLPWRYNAVEDVTNEIEFLPGPEWSWLTEKSQASYCNNAFIISTSSDRMGYRLQGEKLEQRTTEQLISSPVNFGTVQLLPNGQLIVLMADHQTTGGYPRIASVISAHLPKLAQQTAGNEIKFVTTTIDAAEEKSVALQNSLVQLQNTCKLKFQNWLNAH